MLSWCAEQPKAVRDWITSTAFRGDAGTLAWIPTDPSIAKSAAALAIVGPDPLYAIGDLPHRLPPGTYRAVTLQTASPDLTVLGWGLGAYRYTHYKTAERAPARLVVPTACDATLVRNQLDAISLVRDLINAPASDMLPEQLAEAATAIAKEFDATCNVTVGDDLLNATIFRRFTRSDARARTPRA